MEESKAEKAELMYIDALRDARQVTYSLVNVKGGDAVIKDVVINGMSIKEIFQEKK